MKISLLLIAALLSVLVACGSSKTSFVASPPSSLDLQYISTPSTLDLWIITDKQTGCQYLVTKDGYSGGVTAMPETCGGDKN